VTAAFLRRGCVPVFLLLGTLSSADQVIAQANTPGLTIRPDGNGQATVRAVRLDGLIRVDGRLDDEFYRNTPAMTGFVQNDPAEGELATENTEVWVFFDDAFLYVSARCWETQPERMILTEMRRDNLTIFQNDSFSFILDTFHDRRNGFLFIINALGGRVDGEISNERQLNRDWNPVWQLKTRRFPQGWEVEAAIPFKSLRYRPGTAQQWGFNARRVSRWKNELSHLVPMPRALLGQALWHTSLAPTLVGLQVPPGSKNVVVKPYALSSLATDRRATPPVSNDGKFDAGVDAKIGITANLTADVTYNTDFAQAEADEQQINLTRFSLFFPEKRDFFLENAGLFSFGGAGTGTASGDIPVLFYSRRIGLHEDRVVPVNVGGRLTGRIGAFSVGALSLRTGDDHIPSTQFSVFRVRRDVLRRSNVGLIYTGRSNALSGQGSNEAYGVDGNFGFFDNLTVGTYWAETRTQGLDRANRSYRGALDYAGDKYGVELEHLSVGRAFNPEVGFVRRRDMRRSYGLFRYSPRPRSLPAIRRFSWTGSLDYVENGSGRLESREIATSFTTEFESGDRVNLSLTGAHEALFAPFRIASNVTLPVGSYDYLTFLGSYTFGTQRRATGTVAAETGSFYNGRKSTLTVSGGRLSPTSQLMFEPTVSVNAVDVDQGRFRVAVVGTRVTFMPSPLGFVSALIQYGSAADSLTANLRFRWEYAPGSELFVVYNEDRNTGATGFPSLGARSLIVKINRALQF
jgi:hypothetical protein